MVFANDIYFMMDLNIFLQLDNKKPPPPNLIQKQAGHLMDISSKKKRYTIGREAPEKMFNIISH